MVRNRTVVTTERERLFANGYQPVEVRTQTKDGLKKGYLRTTGVPPFDPRFANTGLLTATVRVVDFDIDSPDLMQVAVAAVGAIFGPTPLLRMRPGSPRIATLYRPDAPGWRKTVIRLPVRHGAPQQIELMGPHNYLLALGVHPSGAALTWPHLSPVDLPVAALPVVTEAMVAALVAEVGRAYPQPVRTPGGGTVPFRLPQTGANAAFAAGVADPVTVEDALEILRRLPNDHPPGHPDRIDYDMWYRLAYSCHAVLRQAAALRGEDPRHPSAQARVETAALRLAFALFSADHVPRPGAAAVDPERQFDACRGVERISDATLLDLAFRLIPGFVPPSRGGPAGPDPAQLVGSAA
jgi:hypothetical protein